ncbi:hypothetical protein J7E25_10650 [Agromyces sp. ISL-38]|uniref:hypothetical protein n=1 Tax=Agromyces sp. ISL-38 TaxID=2819107 RepID=UPI001BEBFEF1|nr:hypothetical protein [Agromyces sp. ISL-38]MBT2499558.1 hypothetical protein [Agromyces sp. ISL-38]
MIERLLVNSVSWSERRSIMGPSAYVPEAFGALLEANTDEEADAAYWQLDNRIVVQGQLFEASRWLIGPLVTALGRALWSGVRLRIVNLLVEIALGQPDESELRAGNEALLEHCHRELLGGLWVFYGLLEDPDPDVRIGAIDLLETVEPDRDRLIAVLTEARIHDADFNVARRASEVIKSPE